MYTHIYEYTHIGMHTVFTHPSSPLNQSYINASQICHCICLFSLSQLSSAACACDINYARFKQPSRHILGMSFKKSVTWKKFCGDCLGYPIYFMITYSVFRSWPIFKLFPLCMLFRKKKSLFWNTNILVLHELCPSSVLVSAIFRSSCKTIGRPGCCVKCLLLLSHSA